MENKTFAKFKVNWINNMAPRDDDFELCASPIVLTSWERKSGKSYKKTFLIKYFLQNSIPLQANPISFRIRQIEAHQVNVLLPDRDSRRDGVETGEATCIRRQALTEVRRHEAIFMYTAAIKQSHLMCEG